MGTVQVLPTMLADMSPYESQGLAHVVEECARSRGLGRLDGSLAALSSCLLHPLFQAGGTSAWAATQWRHQSMVHFAKSSV
mmetsp:Transcript_134431/g.287605  ORF Transcript_134431/g.287605 Transcript_134431/m.287605 type:complete len:81 (+) Transcript_134431:145-387(+)